MVIHDILHIHRLRTGIQLDLKSLRIIRHKTFLHAVKALVQPDAIHMHFLEHRQILIRNAHPGKYSRVHIRDDFHAAGMGLVRQTAKLLDDFLPALFTNA